MKTFTNKDAARTLHKLYDTKALFAHVVGMLHPVQEDDLEARAQLFDEEAAAMTMAEEAVQFLDKVLQSLAGTEAWPKALAIAYAPNNLGGYKRVAEYYRRAELIQTL